MRVLVGAALVVGTLADGHCANTDCTACADAFEVCGGQTNTAGLVAALTEWDAIATPTDVQTNCINKGTNIAFAARNDNAAACTAVGGTEFAAFVAAVDASCTGDATGVDAWAVGDGQDACENLATVATCTGSGGAGPSTASQELCEVEQTNDDAVVATFTPAVDGTGECTDDQAAVTTTQQTDCAGPSTWAALGTCETTTGSDAAVDATGGDAANTAAECNALTAAATTWTPTFAAATTAAYDGGNAESGGCTGGADATTAGDFGTGCTAAQAGACVAFYDQTAQADCLTPAGDDSSEEPAGSASPSADGSDASPASMLQVGAAVLASLAMLL